MILPKCYIYHKSSQHPIKSLHMDLAGTQTYSNFAADDFALNVARGVNKNRILTSVECILMLSFYYLYVYGCV